MLRNGTCTSMAGARLLAVVLPFGNSEDRDSPHHSDQSVLFGQRKLKPAWFTLEEIQANLESRKVLTF